MLGMNNFSGGVFPAFMMDFKIGKKGMASTVADMVSIADIEEWSPSIEGNIADFSPFSAQGWKRNIMTGKGFTIDCKGKRSVGDEGNDYVAGMAWKDGLDCSTKVEVIFPDGAKLSFNCVVDVTNPGGGASTDLASLEFKLVCDGKPTWTDAPKIDPTPEGGA